VSHQPVDPSRFSDYMAGDKRAYVLVAGKHQFFPKRELDTIEYSIEDTYKGLYQELRGYLGKPRKTTSDPLPPELTYARYGLWRYVKIGKQKHEPYASLHRAGANLRGLIRVLLFKRFESSVFAFQETVRRLLRIHTNFLKALDQGFVPAGEDAQTLLYESDSDDELDLVAELRRVSTTYNADDFDLKTLRSHIEHDITILDRVLSLVEPIKPEQDAKLQTLIKRFGQEPLKSGKLLIFTQYADTARYLFENLAAHANPDELEVIFSGDKSKARVVGRFAPKANPEYKFAAGEKELNTVVATDVLSEGLNLQDCNKIINYDLHWNPVRLIQRFGRIDRIGSDFDKVYGFNFLPETGLDRNLGLRQKLHNRVQEIHDTIGEDSAILDSTERLNEEAMYAIYEKKGKNLSLFEEDEEENFVDLNEAEEILRQLRKERPEEYERIANMRDGIRSAMASPLRKGTFVFCQADRYQQLFLLDEKGEVVSRDIPKVLGAIKCGPETPTERFPNDYNTAVMRVKSQFAEEVKHREAEREHTVSLTHGQRYVLRELRILFGRTEDEDIKAQINVLEKAFRAQNLTSAVKKELNIVRRNNMVGEQLLKGLVRIYQQHNVRDWVDRQRIDQEKPIPRIICSEALV
jgi:superfamily II DNA/RNA helicase